MLVRQKVGRYTFFAFWDLFSSLQTKKEKNSLKSVFFAIGMPSNRLDSSIYRRFSIRSRVVLGLVIPSK